VSLLYWYKSTNTDAEGAGKGGWNLRGAAGRAPEHPVPYYDAARAHQGQGGRGTQCPGFTGTKVQILLLGERANLQLVPYYDAARARVKVKAGEVPSFLLLLQTYTTVAGVYRMRRMLTYADVC